MNFVDKQHIVGLKRSEYPGQIARLVENRTGSNLKSYPQLIGNNIGKCGFPQSGGAVQKHMIQRFSTHTGSTDKNFQIFHHLVLPAETAKRQWP